MPCDIAELDIRIESVSLFLMIRLQTKLFRFLFEFFDRQTDEIAELDFDRRLYRSSRTGRKVDFHRCIFRDMRFRFHADDMVLFDLFIFFVDEFQRFQTRRFFPFFDIRFGNAFGDEWKNDLCGIAVGYLEMDVFLQFLAGFDRLFEDDILFILAVIFIGDFAGIVIGNRAAPLIKILHVASDEFLDDDRCSSLLLRTGTEHQQRP